jgi:hypothetical protein
VITKSFSFFSITYFRSLAVNRFMVVLGVGSLLLTVSMMQSEVARGEMPRLTSSSVLPTGPNITWHNSLDAGWAESRRRQVPMVIFITSKQCHYCDSMKRDTWCDPSVRQRMAGDFVAIELTPARNSHTLSRIDVKMYPMTLVGLPAGKIISHRLGYQPPSGLHGLLSEAIGR